MNCGVKVGRDDAEAKEIDNLYRKHMQLGKPGKDETIKFMTFQIVDKTNIVVCEKETVTHKDGLTEWKDWIARMYQDGEDKETTARYIVFDWNRKVYFIMYNPDNGPVKQRMMMSSGKAALLKALQGIAKEYQCNDWNEVQNFFTDGDGKQIK